MEITLVVLAIVVVAVAIDALGRLDERRPRGEPVRGGGHVTTEKIIVDLSDREHD